MRFRSEKESEAIALRRLPTDGLADQRRYHRLLDAARHLRASRNIHS